MTADTTEAADTTNAADTADTADTTDWSASVIRLNVAQNELYLYTNVM